MNATLYLLIRRTPLGAVIAHPAPFGSVKEAARVAGLMLYDNTAVSGATAQAFGAGLATLPVGSLYEHDSGYQFRILAADFTDNGVPITPGLRVLTNDLTEGTVSRAQFMRNSSIDPGGQYFNNWYDVDIDGYGRKSFNGERLTTDGSRFGRLDVPRETPPSVEDKFPYFVETLYRVNGGALRTSQRTVQARDVQEAADWARAHLTAAFKSDNVTFHKVNVTAVADGGPIVDVPRETSPFVKEAT